MTQETLKLALETLEKLACLGNGQTYGNSIGNNIAMNAITAIKKALAKEQAPVGFAGVKIWVGNQQVVKLLTQTELDRAIEPCGLLEQAAEMCIEELKEVNT